MVIVSEKEIEEYCLFNVHNGSKLNPVIATNSTCTFLLETTIVVATPFTTKNMTSDSIKSLNRRGSKCVHINKREI